jgi:hypothetical protein
LWQQLAAKINAQLGLGITAADLATLQAREVALLGEMGVSPIDAQANTTWWHLREGSESVATHSSRIKKQFYALHEGVLAVPQPTTAPPLFVDPVERESLQDIQVALTAGGGGAAIMRGIAGMNLLRQLIQTLGRSNGQAAYEVVKRTLGPAGSMTLAQYNRLPNRLKDNLAQAGLTAAILAGFEWGDDDEEEEGIFIMDADTQELIDQLMGDGFQSMIPAVQGMMFGGGIVKAWTAGSFKNGQPIRFYRTADGRVWVQRENGTWKSFTYKKGVMIYSDGATTLRSFLRADRALDHQAKLLRRALDRRAPRRQPRALKAPTIIETGPGSVHVR